jgi:hypothetical protein
MYAKPLGASAHHLDLLGEGFGCVLASFIADSLDFPRFVGNNQNHRYIPHK